MLGVIESIKAIVKNALQVPNTTYVLFNEKIGIKPEIKDKISIDYTKINAANLIDLLYRFTNAQLVTKYKNSIFIVTQGKTHEFDVDKWVYVKEHKGVLIASIDGIYALNDVEKIDDFDHIKHRGIDYYLVRSDRTIYLLTSVGLRKRKYENKDLDWISKCFLVSDKDHVYVACKGIRAEKRFIVYYNTQFNRVLTKGIDEFGNVTFSSQYIPKD